MFVNSLQGSLLIASNMKKELVRLTGAAAIVNIILNLILIPSYGIRGSAIAIVVSEFIAGCWAYLLLRKHNPPTHLTALFLQVLTASAAMAVVVINFPNFHVLIRVAFGMATYAVGLVIVRGFNKSDMKIIRDVIGIR
jgi:O-antigen/teichoic acid export membrane protein